MAHLPVSLRAGVHIAPATPDRTVRYVAFQLFCSGAEGKNNQASGSSQLYHVNEHSPVGS
jgi:hypothetical protein